METYHAEGGESLWAAIARVKSSLQSELWNSEGILVFNGYRIRLWATSHEYDIAEKYDLLRQINQ